MDKGCDTGPVFSTVAMPIGPDDTVGSLTDSLAALGAEALLATLPRIQLPERAACRAPLAAVAQDSARACYAHKVVKAEAELDWRLPPLQLARLVRAFNPRPVTFSHFSNPKRGSGYTRIWRAEPITVAGREEGLAGEVVAAGPEGVDVLAGASGGGGGGAGWNALRLLEVQPGDQPDQSLCPSLVDPC